VQESRIFAKMPIVKGSRTGTASKQAFKGAERELLIRGNFLKNSISELTAVVEESYTTDWM